MKVNNFTIQQGFPKRNKVIKSRLLKNQLQNLLNNNIFGISKPENALYGYKEIQTFFVSMNTKNKSGNIIPRILSEDINFNLPDQETVSNRLKKQLEIENSGNKYLLSEAVKLPALNNPNKFEKIKQRNTKIRLEKVKKRKKNSSRLRQRDRGVEAPQGIYLSMDLTLIPNYTKKLGELEENNVSMAYYLTKSKSKASTNIFTGFSTIYSVEPGARQTLGIRQMVRHKDKNGNFKREKVIDTVKYLLEPVLEEIKIAGLTADGAYNVVEVHLYLVSKKIDYVIRGKSSKKITEIIENNCLHLMVDGSGFEYPEPFYVESGRKKVQVKLIIVRRGEELTPLILPTYSDLSPEQAILLYEERFGIETSYREIKRYLPQTSSMVPNYRLVRFFMSTIFYNLLLYYHEIVIIQSSNPQLFENAMIALIDCLYKQLKNIIVSSLIKL